MVAQERLRRFRGRPSSAGFFFFFLPDYPRQTLNPGVCLFWGKSTTLASSLLQPVHKNGTPAGCPLGRHLRLWSHAPPRVPLGQKLMQKIEQEHAIQAQLAGRVGPRFFVLRGLRCSWVSHRPLVGFLPLQDTRRRPRMFRGSFFLFGNILLHRGGGGGKLGFNSWACVKLASVVVCLVIFPAKTLQGYQG